MNMKYGDVFRHELAGGGGWGDPMERSVDKVLVDVRNGYVTVDGAKRDYGVSIDPQTGLVNEEQTNLLRSETIAKRQTPAPRVTQPRPSEASEENRQGGRGT